MHLIVPNVIFKTVKKLAFLGTIKEGKNASEITSKYFQCLFLNDYLNYRMFYNFLKNTKLDI